MELKPVTVCHCAHGDGDDEDQQSSGQACASFMRRASGDMLAFAAVFGWQLSPFLQTVDSKSLLLLLMGFRICYFTMRIDVLGKRALREDSIESYSEGLHDKTLCFQMSFSEPIESNLTKIGIIIQISLVSVEFHIRENL